MKKVKAVLLGAGNRGMVYASYSKERPEELEIIAVIDTNDFKLKEAQKVFNLSDDKLYLSLDDFLNDNIKCDFVINATMDEIHYETSIKLLKHGYNLLLEKPIVGDEKKLLSILNTARKHDCKICVCHVLRYTPFYMGIKNIIEEGTIGTINSLQLNEHVWNVHYVNSYVRGKWRNQKMCGSPFLLAKSCHDMDLICWLNNKATPVSVSSFGSRQMYKKENAPKGSTEYCYNCPCQKDCYYNAEFMEIKVDFFPKYTWKGINKPYKDITLEEKREYLKTDIMGKCVYKTDMDIVDRQTVSIEFDNGSIASFNLVGGTAAIGRNIHICGTEGEIVGSLADNKIKLRTINKETSYPIEKEIDFNVVHSDGRENVDSHFGGDFGIMENVCSYFRGEKVTSSLTKIEDSINSHLVCFAAERARKKRKIVKIKKI